MGNNTLLAATALMSLLLVLAWLPPRESLHPSRRTLLLLGLAGGLVSWISFEALRWNAPCMMRRWWRWAGSSIAMIAPGKTASIQ